MAKTSTHSPRFETVKRYYDRGTWNVTRLEAAVRCGWITDAEREEIIGGDDEKSEQVTA